jgi:Spy/CpxP family protein refolding chaperone
MKRFSLTTLTLALGVAVASAAFARTATAQNPVTDTSRGRMGGRGMMTFERMADREFKGITLTDDQSAKLKEIYNKHHGEMDKISDGKPMTQLDSTQRAQLRMHNEAMHSDMRAVLTEEQQKVYDENMKSMMQGRGMRRPQGR